jgi:hypothetical protein
VSNLPHRNLGHVCTTSSTLAERVRSISGISAPKEFRAVVRVCETQERVICWGVSVAGESTSDMPEAQRSTRAKARKMNAKPNSRFKSGTTAQDFAALRGRLLLHAVSRPMSATHRAAPLSTSGNNVINQPCRSAAAKLPQGRTD